MKNWRYHLLMSLFMIYLFILVVVAGFEKIWSKFVDIIADVALKIDDFIQSLYKE